MITWLQNIFRDRNGSVLTEAALILPFLITIGVGAIDASYMLFQNHKLETQLTMAGNFLAKSRTPSQFETEAKNLACSGELTSTTCVLPNWSVSDITIAYTDVANAEIETGYEYRGGGTVKVVTISSNISYSGFGVISSIFGNSVRLNGSYEERVIGTE